MSTPEKNPKDDPKPELGAILPDVFADLDNYQKKIENDWEVTKSAYKDKINEILDDFMKQNPATPGAKPEAPRKISSSLGPDPVSSVEERMEKLMSRVENTLRITEEKPRFFSTHRHRPSIINIPWNDRERYGGAFKLLGVVAVLLLAGFVFYMEAVRIDDRTSLPYIHPSTIVFADEKIYIVEWFRKVLYHHSYKKGLPIEQVENIPNNFLSGVAFSDKHLWTLDAFNHQLLQHSLGSDHRVLKTFPTPGPQPAGLFWDGADLWSSDLEKKKIYRHHGADPESIKAEYAFTDFNASALYYKENRLWILDAKSRMVYLCRLEDPLRRIATYDLDPFLKGASPTNFTMKDGQFWLLTENPPQLLRLDLN